MRGFGVCVIFASTPARFAVAMTFSANSPTENCSVNWLNTRNSPVGPGSRSQLDAPDGVADVDEAAGLPPLPYTVSGWPITAWMTKRLSTVPNTAS